MYVLEIRVNEHTRRRALGLAATGITAVVGCGVRGLSNDSNDDYNTPDQTDAIRNFHGEIGPLGIGAIDSEKISAFKHNKFRKNKKEIEVF